MFRVDTYHDLVVSQDLRTGPSVTFLFHRLRSSHQVFSLLRVCNRWETQGDHEHRILIKARSELLTILATYLLL